MSSTDNLSLNISNTATKKVADEFLSKFTASKITSKSDVLSGIVNRNSFIEIKNGDYGITLKDYTTLNSYRTNMNSLYGNLSANKFTNYLNKLYGDTSNSISAQDVIDKIREKGVSNNSALKVYQALNKYSFMSNDMVNNSFVSAKI